MIDQPLSALAPNMTYRLWVNEDSTILVRLWSDGTCETASREHRSHTWGPPVYLTEEKLS